MRERDNDVTNFSDVTNKDSEDDYDDYDKESSQGGNMDWDSIGDFNQYPKAAGSDVSAPKNKLTPFITNTFLKSELWGAVA